MCSRFGGFPNCNEDFLIPMYISVQNVHEHMMSRTFLALFLSLVKNFMKIGSAVIILGELFYH